MSKVKILKLLAWDLKTLFQVGNEVRGAGVGFSQVLGTGEQLIGFLIPWSVKPPPNPGPGNLDGKALVFHNGEKPLHQHPFSITLLVLLS
jgi:hypothetical protein